MLSKRYPVTSGDPNIYCAGRQSFTSLRSHHRGEDAAKELRGLDDLGAIPIVVLTAEQADAVAFPGDPRARFTAQQGPLLTASTRTSQRTIAGDDHNTIVTRPEHAVDVAKSIRAIQP
jgi:hypothetical protein